MEIDGLLHVSGQLPFNAAGVLITGRLGETLTTEKSQTDTRACAVMLRTQAAAALRTVAMDVMDFVPPVSRN